MKNKRLIMQIIVEVVIVALAWYWFNWKLALILFLILWARNMEISNRTRLF